MEKSPHTEDQHISNSSLEVLPPVTISETPGTMSPENQEEINHIHSHNHNLNHNHGHGHDHDHKYNHNHNLDHNLIHTNDWQTASLSSADDDLTDKLYHDMRKSETLHSLNPYKSALTISDINSCIALENASFGELLAASSEKISYRLNKSSGLNIGLFTTVSPENPHTNLKTYTHSRSTEVDSPRKTVLIAHILTTQTENETVSIDDMSVGGHNQYGKTIALHSLAVLPELQGSKIGSTLLKSFIQMTKDAKNFERISLLAFEKLVPWYEKFGFENLGKSECTYGNEQWYDMVLEFPDQLDTDDEDDEEMV